MAKFVFSETIREKTRLEVVANYTRMLELEEQRKQVLAEYHRLEEEVKRLNNAIRDACDLMGIDYQWENGKDGERFKMFFLREDSPD